MKRVTVSDVMRWRPCDDYPRKRIEELFAGRETLGWREILALDLPAKCLLWVLLRPEFLSERRLHLLACDFAERVLVSTDDPSFAEAIHVKRRWMEGQATDTELVVAMEDAQNAADIVRTAGDAEDDELAAVAAAMWATAPGAAGEAAWGAAVEAARATPLRRRFTAVDRQLALVVAALEEE